MSKDDDSRFPDFPSGADGERAYQVAHTVLGAANLAFPLLGAGLQKFVDGFIGAPLNKRRTIWFQLVSQRLQDLDDGQLAAKLVDNEDFISTIIDATFAAIRTKHDEKRQALANAVANIALGLELDEVLRGAFIGYIDQFSPMHLGVLRILHDPRQDLDFASRAVELLRESREAILGGPRVPADKDLVLVRVLNDLSREGLIDSSLNPSASTPSESLKRSTKFGEKFIDFISAPPAAQS